MKRKYGDRVREIEFVSTTPLVFATTGGMDRETTAFSNFISFIIFIKIHLMFFSTNLTVPLTYSFCYHKFFCATCFPGVWSSPATVGERPPPCADFAFTAIDGHRAIVFAGYQAGLGRVDFVYIMEFRVMVCCQLSTLQLV